MANLPLSEEQMMEVVKQVATDKEPVIVKMGMMDVFMLVAQLQLVAKHPELSEMQISFAKKMGKQFQKAITDVHPEAEKVMALGWDSRFDVDKQGDFVNDFDGNKPMVVHNIFTLYTDDDKEDADALLSFGFRPQDWGDPKWKYKTIRTIFTLEGKEIDHTAHFWYTQKLTESELIQSSWVTQMITQVMLPGCTKEVCGRDFLREDDFWMDEWGKMPPFFEEEYDDEDFDY